MGGWLPYAVIIMVAVAVVMAVILKKSYFGRSIFAVSYTHLDVYKRQLQTPLHRSAEGFVSIARKSSGLWRFGTVGENHMSISNARLCIDHRVPCGNIDLSLIHIYVLI